MKLSDLDLEPQDVLLRLELPKNYVISDYETDNEVYCFFDQEYIQVVITIEPFLLSDKE